VSASEEKFYRARVTKRVDFSQDLWAIRVVPGGPFNYVPGQYATLGVLTGEKHVERPYSIVSAPHEQELEFFIELVPHGELTPLLYKLHVGDEMTMRKVPKGRFTLDTKSGRSKHLLLATVTGVAPFVSYVRHLYRQWEEGVFKGEHTLCMIEGASRSWEFGYREELKTIAAEVPWLQFVTTVSRPWEDFDWDGENGRVEDVIRKYADRWKCEPGNTSAYLCGHPQMIANAKGVLARHGFKKDEVREEVYWIPPKESAAS
jgi:ferredoxin--NADP+ reductase